MKKILLALIMITATKVFAMDKVVIGIGEWPPYMGENLQGYGPVSRIVTEAFLQEGIHTKFVFYPWSRSYTLAQNGKINGTAVWFANKERHEIFLVSDPVVDVKYVFFHLKSLNFDWKRISDLHKFRIGGTLYYDYGKDFTDAEKSGDIKVTRTPSDETNLRMLFHKRTEIFPLDINVGFEMIKKEFPGKAQNEFTCHPKAVHEAPLHLLLSKKNAKNRDYIKKFNSGLSKLKKSGRYDELISQIKK